LVGLLLREGWEATIVLCNINEEHIGYIYASQLFNVCCNGLNNFGKMLTFDDTMTEDDVTHVWVGVGCCHAINEPRSYSKWYRRR
jgi:hypothetical protein